MMYLLASLVVVLVAFALVPGGLRWLALLLPHVAVKVVAWALAWVAVKGFSSDDKRSLRWPLRWLETSDADLSGDSYWKIELAAIGADPLADENRIAWIRRNGGHKINYGWFGRDVSRGWLDRYRSPVNGWITGGPLWVADDAFCLRLPIVGLELYAGWNLLGPIDGRAKYWAQLRKRRPLNP